MERKLRWLRLVGSIACLAMGAAALQAPLRDAAREVGALSDPVARADLQLDRQLTQERWSREFDQSLAAGDLDLAASLKDLADERGLRASTEQIARLDEARTKSGALRASRDFALGFVRGDSESAAALSGAVVADLSGFGDLRELAREGRKWAAGEEADVLVVGLSAAGLALSVATWTSLGAALPARGGLSVVKALRKTGRLSLALAADVSRVAGEALDKQALKAGLAAAARLDVAAARQASRSLMRPAALAEVRQFGADVFAVQQRAGTRAAQDVLSVATTRAEVTEAARLAAAKGGKTRAVLKVLGRGVLLAGSLTLSAIGGLFAAVGYVFAAASFARRLGEAVGRVFWSAVDFAWGRFASRGAKRRQPASAPVSA